MDRGFWGKLGIDYGLLIFPLYIVDLRWRVDSGLDLVFALDKGFGFLEYRILDL